MNHQTASGLLDAYLDGAVGAQARWGVTAHLDECAVCRQHAAQGARARELVRERLAAVEPPREWHGHLRAALATESTRLAPEVTAPARTPAALRFVALLGPALVAIWLLARVTTPVAESAPNFTASLLVAHALFAQDESLLDVTGDAETISSWFRDEVGLRVVAPELDGYELLGGRLTAIDGQTAAQLVYEAPADEVYLSLLRFAAPGSAAMSALPIDDVFSARQGTVSMITWSSGGERLALIAAAPETELRRLAAELAAEIDSASVPTA